MAFNVTGINGLSREWDGMDEKSRGEKRETLRKFNIKGWGEEQPPEESEGVASKLLKLGVYSTKEWGFKKVEVVNYNCKDRKISFDFNTMEVIDCYDEIIKWIEFCWNIKESIYRLTLVPSESIGFNFRFWVAFLRGSNYKGKYFMAYSFLDFPPPKEQKIYALKKTCNKTHSIMQLSCGAIGPFHNLWELSDHNFH